MQKTKYSCSFTAREPVIPIITLETIKIFEKFILKNQVKMGLFIGMRFTLNRTQLCYHQAHYRYAIDRLSH